jgi:hypothetical protein
MEFLAGSFQDPGNAGATSHVAEAVADQDRGDLVQATKIARGIERFQNHRLGARRHAGRSLASK